LLVVGDGGRWAHLPLALALAMRARVVCMVALSPGA